MQREEFVRQFTSFIEGRNKQSIKDFFNDAMDEFEDEFLGFIRWFRELYIDTMRRYVNTTTMLVIFENNFDLWYDTLRLNELNSEE